MKSTLTGNPLIVFVHIPKTAGSTLTRILSNQYGADAVYALPGVPANIDPDQSSAVHDAMDKFKQVGNEGRSKVRLLKGHFHFGIHEMLEEPSVYFTILRDPVQRVFSMYYHILRKPTHSLHSKIVGEQWTLEQFVASDFSHELSNDQVRRLAGLKESELRADPRGGLEVAKSNIESHFLLAGLTERFDETLILLANGFNWSTPYYVSRNVGSNRTRTLPSKEAMEIVESRNAEDIDLYRWVAARFEENVRNLGVGFQDELKRFKQRNKFQPAVRFAKGFIRDSMQSARRRFSGGTDR